MTASAAAGKEGPLLKLDLDPMVAFGRRAVAPEEKKRLVRDLFDPIAATYDLADTILSAGLDARWRRKAIALLGLRPGQTGPRRLRRHGRPGRPRRPRHGPRRTSRSSTISARP